MKKLLKTLESAQTALKEAASITDEKKRQAKTLEAQKALDSAFKAVSEASLKPQGEADGAKTITDGEEAETEEAEPMQHDPENPNCECEACAPSDGTSGDGGEDASSHTITHKVVSKGKAAIAAAGKESERKELLKIAVNQLIAESGIDKKYFDVPALCELSLREARADIGKQKRMHEAAVATVLSKVGHNVSASHRAREAGATGGEGNDENEAPNNSEFPLLSVAE